MFTRCVLGPVPLFLPLLSPVLTSSFLCSYLLFFPSLLSVLASSTLCSLAESWVTLATNDTYCLGALVLGESLKQVGTSRSKVILITPEVSRKMRDVLSQVFDVVREVDAINSGDEQILALMKRPELGVTLTKIHCWSLVEYSKCVFLDSDTLFLRNADELFEKEELSAVCDIGWPDCFNSGVFVFKPSRETFNSLVKLAAEEGSFDGGDQGLLNSFFSDWSTADISRHLSFIYNMTLIAAYSYPPAYKRLVDCNLLEVVLWFLIHSFFLVLFLVLPFFGSFVFDTFLSQIWEECQNRPLSRIHETVVVRVQR